MVGSLTQETPKISVDEEVLNQQLFTSRTTSEIKWCCAKFLK